MPNFGAERCGNSQSCYNYGRFLTAALGRSRRFRPDLNAAPRVNGLRWEGMIQACGETVMNKFFMESEAPRNNFESLDA